jgi:membrane protein
VVLPKVRQFLTELSRIELVDRSLVLGAQALLAVVPLLIVLGDALPEAVTTDIVAQLRALLGVDARDLEDVRKAMTAEAAPVNTSLLSLLVAAFSASSFGRALQRLYTRVWGVRLSNPAASYGSALLWIVGWVVAFQMLLLLLRTLSGLPLSGLLSVALQLTVSAGLWWWTAWFLLGRQVRWRRLLPTAVASAVGIVVFRGSRRCSPRRSSPPTSSSTAPSVSSSRSAPGSSPSAAAW